MPGVDDKEPRQLIMVDHKEFFNQIYLHTILGKDLPHAVLKDFEEILQHFAEIEDDRDCLLTDNEILKDDLENLQRELTSLIENIGKK